LRLAAIGRIVARIAPVAVVQTWEPKEEWQPMIRAGFNPISLRMAAP
jgi:hypothetical protein